MAASLLATELAATLLAKLAELKAMSPGQSTPGSKPNVQGAILSADHKGYRSQLLAEIGQLQSQLRDLGYTIDDAGQAVPLASIITTYGAVVG